jgi:hypothetical protein
MLCYTIAKKEKFDPHISFYWKQSEVTQWELYSGSFNEITDEKPNVVGKKKMKNCYFFLWSLQKFSSLKQTFW